MKNLIRRARTTDGGLQTYDRRTIDSTGAFLIGELERLDPTLHEPLFTTTWTRDIQLREDVTIADETSSFTNSTFAAAGGINPTGKSWVGKNTNAVTGVQLDIGKTAQPLTLWAMELSYTLPELESSQKLGRPIDAQKFSAIRTKHNMDVDEQVYIGDTGLSYTGLVNNANASTSNVVANGSSHTTWALKISDDATGNVGPQQIVNDINTLLTTAWANSGWAVCPSELRVPPTQFGLLAATRVSSAGNISLLEYIKQNTIANQVNGRPLNIQPLKWLVGRGASSTDRMVTYTNDKERVRFPMTPLQRTQLEYRSLFQLTTYFGRLGVVEFPYVECIAYGDGI